MNVTPDSFSDGGRWATTERAVEHALRLRDEGADWLDVGGESTRPGAAPVSVEEETRRVVPVIASLAARAPDTPISVDTSKSEVARRAIEAGARIVNDVTALGDPAMGALCARAGVTLVLMHMRGRPRTMQDDTHYDDLVEDVRQTLAERVAVAIDAGVHPSDIVIDPGVGFGKALDDNPRLVAAVPRFASLGHRVLVGASRKAFIGRLTGVPRAEDRVFGSVGVALAAAEAGADILRVHDVAATRRALTTYLACRGAR